MMNIVHRRKWKWTTLNECDLYVIVPVAGLQSPDLTSSARLSQQPASRVSPQHAHSHVQSVRVPGGVQQNAGVVDSGLSLHCVTVIFYIYKVKVTAAMYWTSLWYHNHNYYHEECIFFGCVSYWHFNRWCVTLLIFALHWPLNSEITFLKSLMLKCMLSIDQSIPGFTIREYNDCIITVLRPPAEWRRPVGCLKTSWLRTIDDDIQSLNFGVHTAWRKARVFLKWIRIVWHYVVSTTMLHSAVHQ